RSSTSQSCSCPVNSLARRTSTRAMIVRLRSGGSVADGYESIADTSSGSSVPPMPARSVARRSRSGPWGSGGIDQVNTSGNQKLSGGSSCSGRPTTRSSKDSSVRGSTSSDRCRSSGPPHASSGCRSTSHAWRSEYVSTKCRSSCTWKPWSTAWSFRSATYPAMSMAATAPACHARGGVPHPRKEPGRPAATVMRLMRDELLLGALHDTADAERAALDALTDWGEAGTRAGQYRSDLAADAAALEVLDKAGFGVMSEETGLHNGDRDVIVVIDPVDGSTNASRALPWYATALCA